MAIPYNEDPGNRAPDTIARDIIQGLMRAVLKSLHDMRTAERQDDTEYIRNVKAVLEATRGYARDRLADEDAPGALQSDLYQCAKRMWLDNLRQSAAEENPADRDIGINDDGYYDYYYDYIYNHGVYPP